MRRIAPLVLLMALGGCGYHAWSDLPFTTGSNPNAPALESETMRRVMGEPVQVPPLTPQPGDVWPGHLPPIPTLADIQKTTNLPELPEQPVPGSPLSRGISPNGSPPPSNESQPPSPPPQPSRGSSTPPSLQARPAAPPPVVVPPPSQAGNAQPPAKPPQNQTGQTVNTSRGPGTLSGGGSGYQTMTMPNGGSAIVIPNGNGTSTVIRSDGGIETIPTPNAK